jgi:hypothetical protein
MLKMYSTERMRINGCLNSVRGSSTAFTIVVAAMLEFLIWKTRLEGIGTKSNNDTGFGILTKIRRNHPLRRIRLQYPKSFRCRYERGSQEVKNHSLVLPSL